VGNGGPVQTRTADLYRVKVAVGTQVIEFIEAFGRSGVLKTRVRALIAAISQSEVYWTRPSAFLAGGFPDRSLSTLSNASIDSRTLRGIG
jgi:hypothetical protein